MEMYGVMNSTQYIHILEKLKANYDRIFTTCCRARNLMKMQDKKAEMVSGYEVPDESWLENPLVYKVKKSHIESLHLIPPNDSLILDCGCGPGTYGIILAQEGARVIGIDISTEAVQVAQGRANKKGVSFLSLVGDLELLPFDNDTFDICFCGWTLHHFPDINEVVSGFKTVLKHGGKIAIVEPNESNLLMRLSRFIEDLPLVQKTVLKTGWDTPNRTIHHHEYYLEILKRQGFVDVKFSSCYPGGLPPLPLKSKKGLPIFSQWLMKFSFHFRVFLFKIAVIILPRPLNGADLLITAIKKEE
jgi:ubiquinone/menaquinone biosynthesis C-methylase UbiE